MTDHEQAPERVDPASLAPARHDDPDGPAKGWDAKDVPPDALVDDDWVDEHSTPVEPDAAAGG